MESQVAGQIEPGFSLHFTGGSAGSLLDQEDECPKSCTGPHDNRLEQSTYGLFRALLDRAGLEAPGGAPLPSSVDAAECAAHAGRPIIAGINSPEVGKATS